MAGKAALRPAHMRSRSASSRAGRISVAPAARQMSARWASSASASPAWPSHSQIRMASASSGYPAWAKVSAAFSARESIISSPAGVMPAAMMSATAWAAQPASGKATSSAFTSAGIGSRRTVTSVTTASRPSEPVSSAIRSKPGASGASEPMVSRSPSMVSASSLRMLCTVSPYFRQCTPPAFSATLPPMEQASCDDGSGA